MHKTKYPLLINIKGQVGCRLGYLLPFPKKQFLGDRPKQDFSSRKGDSFISQFLSHNPSTWLPRSRLAGRYPKSWKLDTLHISRSGGPAVYQSQLSLEHSSLWPDRNWRQLLYSLHCHTTIEFRGDYFSILLTRNVNTSKSSVTTKTESS